MSHFFLTSLFFLILPVFSWAQIFIGNNSEAVRVKDKVYLRDLYEMQVAENPYVSNYTLEVFKQMEPRFAHLKRMRVDTRLLMSKLSDAETLRTGLGVYLSEVLLQHRFSFVSSLELSPGTPADLLIPNRAPLSRRIRNSVQIHEFNFKAMPSEHRVALIIHEAVSSLVRLRGNQCEIAACYQSPLDTRWVTGMIFTAPTCGVLLNGNCEKKKIESLLDIEEKSSFSTRPTKATVTYKSTLNPGEHVFNLDALDQYSPAVAAAQLCDHLEALSLVYPVSILLQLEGPGHHLERYIYPFSGYSGNELFQAGYRVRSRTHTCHEPAVLNDRPECDLFTTEQIQNWGWVTDNKSEGSCTPRSKLAW